MARYTIITLVDITRTNPTREEDDQRKLGQQANFNSLQQAIGLRSNISWAQSPRMYTGSLPHPIDGKANHWVWEFDTEREDTFLSNGDPVFLLKEDIHLVPVVPGLDSSADIDPAVFQTIGQDTNTWVFENQ
jgi:hypothetical protein